MPTVSVHVWVCLCVRVFVWACVWIQLTYFDYLGQAGIANTGVK